MTPQQIITAMADKGRMLTQKNEELLNLSEKKVKKQLPDLTAGEFNRGE